MKQFKERNRKLATFSVFFLIPLSGFITDIYLPSFPSMQQALHTSAANIQLTLSYYLVSYGAGMFLAGMVVDSFGRYKVVIGALLTFIGSCIVIATSHSISVIYGMRILQGLASALAVVGKRAFLVDIYSGEKLRHYTGLVSIIWSIAPITAPFVGGYLEKAWGWTSNFWFLTGYATVALVLELVFGGEALKTFKRFHPTTIVHAYKEILGAPDFSFGIVLLGLGYSMVMVFGMSAPFLIEHRYGYSSVVTGNCALISGMGLFIGGIIGKVTAKKGVLGRVTFGLLTALLLATLMYVVLQQYQNLYVLMSFVLLLHIIQGCMYNIVFTYCLTRFPVHAGVSSGLASGGSYLITSLASFLITRLFVFREGYQLSYSYLVLILAMGGIVFYLRTRKIAHLANA
ncbi:MULTISPECIES: MFS transporter [Chitinophagaceae]